MMSSISNLIGATDFLAAVTKIGLGLKPVLPRGGRPRPSTVLSPFLWADIGLLKQLVNFFDVLP